MQELGVELTPAIGEALYVGLVTDTGRFMYENTGPRAHEMAAELLDGGVDGHAHLPAALRGDAAGQARAAGARADATWSATTAGCSRVTHLTLEDYRATGADESYSEGVVDHLRSVEGTAVAGLVRDLLGTARRRAQGLAARDRRPRRRLARSPARRAAAGTGARPASRPTWTSPSWSSSCAPSSRRQLDAPARDDGVLLVDKPAGITSHDVVARAAAARRRA